MLCCSQQIPAFWGALILSFASYSVLSGSHWRADMNRSFHFSCLAALSGTGGQTSQKALTLVFQYQNSHCLPGALRFWRPKYSPHGQKKHHRAKVVRRCLCNSIWCVFGGSKNYNWSGVGFLVRKCMQRGICASIPFNITSYPNQFDRFHRLQCISMQMHSTWPAAPLTKNEARKNLFFTLLHAKSLDMDKRQPLATGPPPGDPHS